MGGVCLYNGRAQYGYGLATFVVEQTIYSARRVYQINNELHPPADLPGSGFQA